MRSAKKSTTASKRARTSSTNMETSSRMGRTSKTSKTSRAKNCGKQFSKKSAYQTKVDFFIWQKIFKVISIYYIINKYIIDLNIYLFHFRQQIWMNFLDNFCKSEVRPLSKTCQWSCFEGQTGVAQRKPRPEIL